MPFIGSIINHLDALRLDAIHAIFDMGAKHFLYELSERVEEFSQKKKRIFYLIAESDLNDFRVVIPRESRGYGINEVWCDDFHHALHTLLTGEKQGYYRDFGEVKHLEKTMREGFVYSGGIRNSDRRITGIPQKTYPQRSLLPFLRTMTR